MCIFFPLANVSLTSATLAFLECQQRIILDSPQLTSINTIRNYQELFWWLAVFTFEHELICNRALFCWIREVDLLMMFLSIVHFPGREGYMSEFSGSSIYLVRICQMPTMCQVFMIVSWILRDCWYSILFGPQIKNLIWFNLFKNKCSCKELSIDCKF